MREIHSKSSKGLKVWCTGRPTNPTRLRKLQQGRHPIDGGYLGEPQRAMGEAWWNATARQTNLARNQRERLGITIVLGSLPEAWAEEIPFEPPEFEVDEEEGFTEEVVSVEEGREGLRAPVGSLLRHLGCLLPSDGVLPTYAAELGQTGEAEPFRVLGSVEPAASTVVGRKPQESGPLRGEQPSGAAEGDLAGPAGRPRWSAGGGGEARRPRKCPLGLPEPPWPGVQGRQVAPPASGCEQRRTDPGGAQLSATSRDAGGGGGCCRGKARMARMAKAACPRICGRILGEGAICQEPCNLAEAHEGTHCFDCMHTLPPPMPARPPPLEGRWR